MIPCFSSPELTFMGKPRASGDDPDAGFDTGNAT